LKYEISLDASGKMVLAVLFILSIWGIWKHYSSLKGIIGESLIDYGTVTGKIIHSETRSLSVRYSGGTGYYIVYKYVIDGKIYKSDIITFAADDAQVDKYLKKYPYGKMVTVYYQKSNPSFAVLEPNTKSWTVFLRAFIWTIFMIVFLSTKIKKIKNTKGRAR
jgi:hypothetical protein